MTAPSEAGAKGTPPPAAAGTSPFRGGFCWVPRAISSNCQPSRPLKHQISEPLARPEYGLREGARGRSFWHRSRLPRKIPVRPLFGLGEGGFHGTAHPENFRPPRIPQPSRPLKHQISEPLARPEYGLREGARGRSFWHRSCLPRKTPVRPLFGLREGARGRGFWHRSRLPRNYSVYGG